MINILLVIPSLALGGAEVFVVRLANHLAQNGHTVFLLDINPTRRSPLMTARISEKVRLLHFDNSLSFSELFQWKILSFLSQIFTRGKSANIFYRKKRDAKKLTAFIHHLVEKHHIQAINSHLAVADWMVSKYFIARKRTPRFIISMHGCYNQSDLRTHPLKQRLHANQNLVFKAADHIVILTPKNELPIRGLQLKNKPVYIPLGFERVPHLSKKNSSKKPITFGLVSRAIPRKGWEEAIEATIHLHKESVHCLLILVGGGAYQQRLEMKFGHLPFIKFAGASAQVLDWVKEFDIGLFPSYIESESYPNTVIEYLACGKPVIGTDIGEVKNMISTPDGQRAGQLLTYHPSGISLDEMVRYMREYVLDPVIRKAHSELAEKAFEKFDMHECVTAYESLYQS